MQFQVTGGNKGIGLAIVKALCKKYDGNVYLTARDVTRGMNAVSELQKQGLQPKFHQLDVTDEESIKKLFDYLKDTYGGLDILVNNAAIAFKVICARCCSTQWEHVHVSYLGNLL